MDVAVVVCRLLHTPHTHKSTLSIRNFLFQRMRVDFIIGTPVWTHFAECERNFARMRLEINVVIGTKMKI